MFGDDQRVVRRQADKVQAILKRVPGVEDPHVNLVGFVPQVEVRGDLAKAQRYGLKPGDIRRSARSSGGQRGSRQRFQGRQGLQRGGLKRTPETRSSVTDIGDLLIVTASGGRVKLRDVAAVVILGGLVTSTLLNLFVVPSLYLRFGKPRSSDAAPRGSSGPVEQPGLG